MKEDYVKPTVGVYEISVESAILTGSKSLESDDSNIRGFNNWSVWGETEQ